MEAVETVSAQVPGNQFNLKRDSTQRRNAEAPTDSRTRYYCVGPTAAEALLKWNMLV